MFQYWSKTLSKAFHTMRKVITGISICASSICHAEDCEPVLHKLVEILEQKGNLATDKYIYPKKFSADEFLSSCRVRYKGLNYDLYLHPDKVSIVVSFIDPYAGKKLFKGPFSSAYRK